MYDILPECSFVFPSETPEGDVEPSCLATVARYLDVREAGLRLVLSLVAGYPIVLFHRHVLYFRSPILQHLYFIITGICISLYNFGSDTIHSATCTFYIWALLHFMGKKLRSVLVSIFILMFYLLKGFYIIQFVKYSNRVPFAFEWTMPQAVLTLRLIGLTIDVYNGARDPARLSSDQRETALPSKPNLLEIAAFVYFPGSFLVGPQFCMKRYLDFINANLSARKPPGVVSFGVIRGLLGLMLLPVFLMVSKKMPPEYFDSFEFKDKDLLTKYFVVGIWGNIMLWRYFAFWLLAEGICITSGIAYNGVNSSGYELWDGCANVSLTTYILSLQLGSVIDYFNISTNDWMKQYVYKRLLTYFSVTTSRLVTLFLIGIWHGLHTGYYHLFAMEFIALSFEENMIEIFDRINFLGSLWTNLPVKCIVKVYVFIFTGYLSSSFILMTMNKWLSLYLSLRYLGHMFLISGYAVTHWINSRSVGISREE